MSIAELDRQLARIVAGEAPLQPGLPSGLSEILDRLLSENTDQSWSDGARQLAAGGLPRAALAAIAEARMRTDDRVRRGLLHIDEANLLRAVGGDPAGARRVARRLFGDPDNDEAAPESRSGGLGTLTRRNDPVAAARLDGVDPDAARVARIRQADLDIADTPVGAAEDLSFFVLRGDRAAARVDAWVRGDGPVRFGALPVALPASAGDEVLAFAIGHLRRLADWAGAMVAEIETGPEIPLEPAPVRDWLASRSVWARRVEYARIDLDRSEDEIFADFHENHRRNVRKSMAAMRIAAWSPGDNEMLADYFDLKRANTRFSFESPEGLQADLAEGRSHLWMGYEGPQALSAIVTTDWAGVAIYLSGVSAPDPGRPLSHAVMWAAIRAAKARGMRQFDFAPLQSDPGFGEKLAGIARYKRGFVRNTESRLWHCLRVSAN